MTFKTALLIHTFFSTSTSKLMIRKVPQSKLGVSEPDPSWFGNPPNEKLNTWTNKNWLKSRFHFSFAEYSNSRNQEFGVLRVMNDDLVQPERGFGAHPHRNVEICTYVVEGYLTHQDSMGTKETLSKGAIQFMTAGSGVVHSEHNLDSSAPLRFIQMWIKTRQMNLPPNYGSDTGDADLRHNKWMHMVSDVEKCSVVHTPIHINQDVNIFVTEMDPGVNLSFDLEEGRQAYLLCIEGSASLSNDEDSSVVNVERHDAAELYGGMKLSAVASPETGAHLLMVEMQYTGKGRSDL